jgi:hypothetical protein
MLAIFIKSNLEARFGNVSNEFLVITASHKNRNCFTLPNAPQLSIDIPKQWQNQALFIGRRRKRKEKHGGKYIKRQGPNHK